MWVYFLPSKTASVALSRRTKPAASVMIGINDRYSDKVREQPHDSAEPKAPSTYSELQEDGEVLSKIATSISLDQNFSNFVSFLSAIFLWACMISLADPRKLARFLRVNYCSINY